MRWNRAPRMTLCCSWALKLCCVRVRGGRSDRLLFIIWRAWWPTCFFVFESQHHCTSSSSSLRYFTFLASVPLNLNNQSTRVSPFFCSFGSTKRLTTCDWLRSWHQSHWVCASLISVANIYWLYVSDWCDRTKYHKLRWWRCMLCGQHPSFNRF